MLLWRLSMPFSRICYFFIPANCAMHAHSRRSKLMVLTTLCGDSWTRMGWRVSYYWPTWIWVNCIHLHSLSVTDTKTGRTRVFAANNKQWTPDFVWSIGAVEFVEKEANSLCHDSLRGRSTTKNKMMKSCPTTLLLALIVIIQVYMWLIYLNFHCAIQ